MITDPKRRPVFNPFLRIQAVSDLTGLSMATIYRLMSEDRFPRAVALGANTRAWPLSEIEAWQAAKIAARDSGNDAELRVVNPNIGKGRPRKVRQAA